MDIEDSRGLTFKSWKSYARFLKLEIKQLQQLLPSEDVSRAFRGAVNNAKYQKIPMIVSE